MTTTTTTPGPVTPNTGAIKLSGTLGHTPEPTPVFHLGPEDYSHFSDAEITALAGIPVEDRDARHRAACPMDTCAGSEAQDAETYVRGLFAVHAPWLPQPRTDTRRGGLIDLLTYRTEEE